MLSTRISIFVNLPLDKLDRLWLQAKLDEIGQMEGATGKVDEPG